MRLHLKCIFWLALVTSIFAAPLPGPISQDFPIDKEAVGQGVLIVAVRLENSRELPFLVDTGSPMTILDQSLKEKLGKRLDNVEIETWGSVKKGGLYAAPKMYLGRVPLITGPKIATSDLRDVSVQSGFSVRGIIGLDCLTNYCVQIDFAAGKMRFLDRAEAQQGKVGKSYPILLSNIGQGREDFYRLFIHHAGLIGDDSTNVLVDTGLALDGAFDPEYLQRQEASHRTENVVREPSQTRWYFSQSLWDGQIYTNIVVTQATSDMETNRTSLVGLRFLARHLLTLDFPGGLIYLERQRVGAVSSESLDLINLLTTNGKLPDDVNARLNRILGFRHPPLWFRLFGGTLKFAKSGDDTIYHFSLRKQRRSAKWKLKKAWQTDQNGDPIQLYKVP